MQGPSIGFPIHFDQCACDLCIEIVRFDGQRPFQHGCLIGITPEPAVSSRDLLQSKKVPRVKVHRALKTLERLLLLPLAPLDVALELKYHRIIR
jgi:hypothetical protein